MRRLILAWTLLAAASAAWAFPPLDEATAEAMAAFRGDAKSLENHLREAIRQLSDDNHPAILTIVKSLPDGAFAELTAEHNGKAPVIHLRITRAGLASRAVVLEELARLEQVSDNASTVTSPQRHFANVARWAELTWNAQAGSRRAQLALAELDLEAIQAADSAVTRFDPTALVPYQDEFSMKAEEADPYFKARRALAERRLKEARAAAREEARVQKAAWESTKKLRAKLESQKQKLDDLIAKNDRSGVARLVEAFLPWELMEPSEASFWRSWLDAVEHPSKKDTQVVFRGLSDNVVRLNDDGDAFTFSTVLSKNQGNYTRRLRSIETMRLRFGDAKNNIGGIPTFDSMFEAHDSDPKGSPFMSFADLQNSETWGDDRWGAFRIDRRRIIPNPRNDHREGEMLVTLFTFPDELIYFRDYKKQPLPEPQNGAASPSTFEHFRKEVEKRLHRKLTSEESDGISDAKLLKQGTERFIGALSGYGKPVPKGARGCAAEFRKMLKQVYHPKAK